MSASVSREHPERQTETPPAIGTAPPVDPYALIRSAAWDAGQRHADAHGRTVWNAADYDAAVAEFERLTGASAALAPALPDDRARPWYLAREPNGWRVGGPGGWIATGLEADPPTPFATEADALAFAQAFGLSPAARLDNIVHPAVQP